MSDYESYRVTPLDMLSKVPYLLKNSLKIVKALKLINGSDETVPLGLGLLVEEAVEKNPTGAAVIYEDTQINYQDFNAIVNRVAHYLADEKGLKKGDVAIVFLENRPELLIMVSALAKLGVVNAMVNTSLTGKVLEHSINLVKPNIAIVGEELVDVMNTSMPKLSLNVSDCYYVAENAVNQVGEAPQGYGHLMKECENASTENPATTRDIFLKDPAFFVYTSGTTGMPKATVFNHGRVMKCVGAFGYGSMQQTTNDIMYVPLPFYHSTAMSVCWAPVLAGGAAVVIRRKFSVSSFWDDCIKYKATGFGYVGELCRYLYDQEPSPKDRQHKVYKIVGNGLRPSIWREFKARFGIERVHEFYASSEGNVGFSNLFNFDYTVGFSPKPHKMVKYDVETCQPIRGADGFLIETDKAEPGLMIGLICDKSPFDGYTDPEKTAKTIIHDAFEKGDRWFNSGDVMRSIGFNHSQFVDRLGDTFRWKGENVSTTEVESILQEFDGVTDVVTYGVEINNTNGRAGMSALNLEVPEAEFDWSKLFDFAQENLPNYAIPVFIRVRKESVDTTGTFKYKKADLKKEAYYTDQCQGDSVYVLLPGEKTYTKLDMALAEKIDSGAFRF